MASNSVIAEDQADTTAEILRLQSQLAQIRNKRKVLHLRNEIARENQLLTDARHRLHVTASQTPTGGRSFNRLHPPTPVPRGRAIRVDKKRINAKPSHPRPEPVTGNSNASGNLTSTEGAEVPKLPVSKRYCGQDRSLYITLVSNLRSFFRTHQWYFAVDKTKIAEAKRHLSRLVLDEWTTYAQSSDRTYTWDEFCSFLLHQIERPATPKMARHLWTIARQRRDESVRDFANYLGMLEDDFPTPLSEQDRSQRLCEGMKMTLRKRAQGDASFLTLRYDAQIELLAAWEMEWLAR
ncbi:hypothetical protein ANOM_001287 [Aspergillus nomiae NRRL 13137]|uniref:Retrotransposon gag domain-containing protein n=1 Tax=Aspergillus nomiae NRRL (strain ATCC 15546 / NRRL 13137 / CBS 260.88 / M93) TaxID=1509407 RepID=A0A0L1JGV8_ASPN3|nr:uncharacterized protein ANOM_001287 [Aspergillus nomiae NRRL 13137]KNG90638.1 hypothetical protein ANOM_001287 [Aspergillus nomiae NRRL 13137]